MNIKAYFAEKPRAALYIAVGAATLLASGLLLWRTFSANTAVIFFLNYFTKLLVLMIGLAGLGLAYTALAARRKSGIGLAFLVSTGGYLFMQIVAAFCTALAYMDYDFDVTLAVAIGSAFTNTLFQLLLHATVFLFVFLLVFFRKEMPHSPLLFGWRNRYARANLLSVGVLFIFQLAELIADTVNFILAYAPNIYPGEIASMVFEFVFLILSMLLGYVALYAVELICVPEKE